MVRVRTKWHDKQRPKSLEEIAGAVAFTAWRIAQDTVNRMYNDGFNFQSNTQLLDVIGEFLAYLILCGDQLAGERLAEEERTRFTGVLALKLVEHMQENRVEQQGPGDYREAIVEHLNGRLAEYGEYRFVDGQPSYPLLRLFGSHVDTLMGGQKNKWVLEQVMEVEAPAALKNLKKAVDGLVPAQEADVDKG